jgi:deoxyribonuclease V
VAVGAGAGVVRVGTEMDITRSAYLPDPAADRETMESQQQSIAKEARFSDTIDFDPDTLRVNEPVDLPDVEATLPPTTDDPIVVGIDQAFTGGEAISVGVAIQNGRVVDRSVGRAELRFPYIPGLLAFREAGAIVAALRGLDVHPGLLVLDGSGRIHFRQAGIATHVGVLFDVPAIGVAKSLLCGAPSRSIDPPLPAGTRVPILADETVDASAGTVLGHAFQSRQFPNPSRRHVNPLIVSPGHRVSAATTVDVVEAFGAGYKLPEPTHLADRAVDECSERPDVCKD